MHIICLIFEGFQGHLPFSALVVFLLFLARCARYPRFKIVSSPKSAALRQLKVRGHLRIGSPLFPAFVLESKRAYSGPNFAVCMVGA